MPLPVSDIGQVSAFGGHFGAACVCWVALACAGCGNVLPQKKQCNTSKEAMFWGKESNAFGRRKQCFPYGGAVGKSFSRTRACLKSP